MSYQRRTGGVAVSVRGYSHPLWWAGTMDSLQRMQPNGFVQMERMLGGLRGDVDVRVGDIMFPPERLRKPSAIKQRLAAV